MFDKRFVARELNSIARCILAFQPLRKNDTEGRNESHYELVTSHAPILTKKVLKQFVEDLDDEGYEVSLVKPKIVRRDYLHYRDDAKNSNKFHYYALIEFEIDDDGKKEYAAYNCYGRVGFAEKIQDLSGVCETRQEAERFLDKHYSSKVRKGYAPVKLKRG